MSLTTLGSQLAGLNAPRRDPGSNISRSRQHEDSIGRGLSHSVQLGQHDAKKTAVFKASILHEDAAKARDVPLVTLKENCITALRHLELMDVRFGEYAKLLQVYSKERFLMTRAENDELDQIVDALLHRLILRISDNGKNSQTARKSACHVIEYLLRRYEIHLHQPLAETIIRLTVPMHEDPVFLRMIQLVDLSSLPTWSFLRPYAVPGARVAREVISKQASTDVSLLSNLCSLAKRSAEFPCNAHHLSFVAIVMSESAAFQVTNLGDLTERTCHVMLQQTLGACRQSKNSSLQNWGHVTASIIVETASLAEASRSILVTSILSGVAHCKDSTQLNGLVVAFNAISQGWNHLEHPLQAMRYFLTDDHGMKADIFHELLGLTNLSSQLANLFCNERSDHVSHWIACILVVGARLLQENATTRKKKVQILILDLIREPKLRSLWGNASNRFLESFATIFVEILARTPGDAINAGSSFEEAVFKSLDSINSSAFQNGIASALFRLKGQSRKAVLCRIQHKDQYESQTALTNEPLLSALLELDRRSDKGALSFIHAIIGDHKVDESSILQSRHRAKALFEILNHDADSTVAIQAGKVLVDFLRSQVDYDTTKEIGEVALQAAYDWFNSQISSSFRRVSVLVQVFRVLESISLDLASKEPASHLFGRIIECLGAFSSDSNESISQHSSETLYNIIGTRVPGAEERQNIPALLLSDQKTLCVYRRAVSVGQSHERYIRRCFSKLLLQGYVDFFPKCQNDEKWQSYATEMMEYCLWFIAAFVDELQPSEAELVRTCISRLGQYPRPSYCRMRQFATELLSFDDLTTRISPVIQSVFSSLSASSGSKIRVLMDMAVFASQKGKDTAVKKILSVTTTCILGGEATEEEVRIAIATALCFLTDMNIDIRYEAVNLLNNAGAFLASRNQKQLFCLVELCVFVTENKSNLSIGGASLLSWCLARVISQSKQKRELAEVLLGLCVEAAGAVCSSSNLSKNEDFASGGYFTAAKLLAATELAGEEFLPWAKRWELAGSPILKYLESHLSNLEQIPTSLESLCFAVVRMLNGLKAMESALKRGPKSTWNAISSQEASKSCGESKAEWCLNPYPKEMENSILSILNNDSKSKISRLLRKGLVVVVVGSKSWTSSVFPSLSSPFREKITRGILSGMVAGVTGFGQDTLMNLPLTAAEVMGIIESAHSEVEISYLSEYIVVNHKRLNRESPNHKLMSVLFGTLEASFSCWGNRLCESILSAVLKLVNSSSAAQLCAETPEAEVENWGVIILRILEMTSKSHEDLLSLQIHKGCMAVLGQLCPLFPSIVVKSLIPAMNATICIASKASGFLVDCLIIILPQFLESAALVGLSPADLFEAFIFQSRRADGNQRIALYKGFINALSRMPVTTLNESLPGAFVSSCLSMELYFIDNDTIPRMSVPLPNVASMILKNSDVGIIISSAVEMAAYAKEIITKYINGKETLKYETVVKVEDLISFSIKGGTEIRESDNVIEHPKSLLVCDLLLQSVWKNTQSTSFQVFLQNLDSSGSNSFLPFWQDLILIRSACRNFVSDTIRSENKPFWEKLLWATEEILGNLHSFIPVHIFLAFATALVKNGETEELRCTAVRAIADRASTYGPIDSEATLFRETLPFLSEMLGSRSGSMFRQSVLVALEAVARNLCLGNNFQASSTLSDQLVKVTLKAAELIESELSCADSDFEKIAPPSRETICIASLCASTCIRICGPRALKALPTLMKAHTNTLCVSNEVLCNEGVKQAMKKEARLMQFSAMHSIIAVVETLPQFVAPYLKDMLAPLAVPSKALREPDESLDVAKKLDAILVSSIPGRLLIPSVLEAVNSNRFDVPSLLAMVSVLTSTVASSSRQNVVRHATGLLRAVTSTLEYSHPARQIHLLKAAKDLFLGFVLKLSELQLRSLYLKLWEWKGDVDHANLDESATRRTAFWTISAALASTLRTIYLPCLTLVFVDLVKELVSLDSLILFHCTYSDTILLFIRNLQR